MESRKSEKGGQAVSQGMTKKGGAPGGMQSSWACLPLAREAGASWLSSLVPPRCPAGPPGHEDYDLCSNYPAGDHPAPAWHSGVIL